MVQIFGMHICFDENEQTTMTVSVLPVNLGKTLNPVLCNSNKTLYK